jgi:DNA invertase Pin-like site-specific DNA recombinase
MSTTTRESARCVVYDRVSESDPESQAAHLERCREFARARGWRIVAEHVDTASGYSRSAKRPGWDRVVEMVEREEVDVVLVFAVSRAGRNLARFASFVETCREHGVSFASATEPIDTTGPMGAVVLAMLSGLAEMESAVKRERALLGEARHKRDGTYRGGNVGFGFRVDGGGYLVVDEREATLLREAATDVLNGTPLERVARRWNDTGVTTKGGNGKAGSRWTGSHVRTVLSAERNVPRILTESDRRRLLSLFDSRRTGRKPEHYMLTGLVYSAVDGHRMMGRQGAYVDWRPTERPRVRLSIRQHLLDNLVLGAVRERAEAQPFEPTEARDPSDDLVRERDRIILELESLGESDLSEHVLRGRERKLLRELERVEEQLDEAKPAKPRSFWDTYPTDDVFVRQYVKRIRVAPATPGKRWDPSRVSIEWR